jgi:hypothetical protein
MLTQPMMLACLALLGSLVLAFRHQPLGFPMVAMVVSGLEVLMVFGLVHVSVARFPLGAILGAALVVSGVVIYARSSDKAAVAATTAITLVGALQLLAALRLH